VTGTNPFDEILRKDPRFPMAAYLFVMEALGYTVRQIGERRHVSGRELLGGIRDFALDAWGPLARHVFHTWGIRETADFGAIVFNLVENGVLSKTEDDKLEDFANVAGFFESLRASELPELDRNGHVLRRLPDLQPGGSDLGTTFLIDGGLN
jgi:uncharacterized repeat protein (TIGR04138 family)